MKKGTQQDYSTLPTNDDAPSPVADPSSPSLIVTTTKCDHVSLSWHIAHVAGFFTGGLAFIIGTACLFYPAWDNGALVSAWLYIIGSFGFFGVDFLEFFTFTQSGTLRANIGISMFGSFLYILGSVGFLPSVASSIEWIGPWGFILGSVFIASSELWKLYRIGGGESAGGFLFATLTESKDTATQVGVEGGAFLGAAFFFVGTVLYDVGDMTRVKALDRVLALWTCGSVAFFIGSFFLGYRHFVMKL